MLQILFQKRKNSTKVHTIKISFRCNYKSYLKKKTEGNKTERKARREGKRGSSSRKGNKGATEQ